MRTRYLTSVLLAGGCTVAPVTPADLQPFSAPPSAPPSSVLVLFDEMPPSQADVLFVVDNSSSMQDEHTTLQNHAAHLVQHLETPDVDVHVGVVATDMQRTEFSGKLRNFHGHRYLDASTPEPADVFVGMVESLGVITGSIEAGRAAVIGALTTSVDNSTNAGFYREDAELHVIFVSDANDQSQSLTPPVYDTDFWSTMEGLKSWDGQVTSHAIVVPTDAAGCPSTRTGISYLQNAALSGGLTHSICAAEWGPFFEALELGQTGSGRRFFLELAPATYLEVTVEDDGQRAHYPLCTAQEAECVHYRASDVSFALRGVYLSEQALVEVRYVPVP